LPTIEQRDTAAIRAAQLCSDALKAKRQLAELERENLTLCQQNVELAQEVLSLEERAQIPQQVAFRSSTAENEVTSLEREVSTARRRWKVIKGATSAIVAGSGVDWVRDERLKTLVLESLDE
jgi:flagellar biosynthesis chaperone FliJ